MSRKDHELTQAKLQELLAFEPVTGVFTWRVDRQGQARAGDRAGRLSSTTGYWDVCILGRRHGAHRLAWLYVYGVMPADEVDHINGDRSDNRIGNLRDVSRASNHQNRRRARAGSTTGLLGVSPNGERYIARIQVGGARKCLGTYDTPEEAHAAYVSAKREMHPCGTL